MRRCTVILLLTTLTAAPAAAQAAEACKGALWKQVQGWLKPQASFQDTVLYLQSEAIDYAVFDARTVPAAPAGEVEISSDHIGATDCKPRKEAPQCSIVLTEPRAAAKPAAASPTTVESDEIISIDFDAKGSQTGLSCEVVETGL
ncbi:MAG: hypothetical protein Kow00114_21600 [Kiloniellaceae bacterium]